MTPTTDKIAEHYAKICYENQLWQSHRFHDIIKCIDESKILKFHSINQATLYISRHLITGELMPLAYKEPDRDVILALEPLLEEIIELFRQSKDEFTEDEIIDLEKAWCQALLGNWILLFDCMTRKLRSYYGMQDIPIEPDANDTDVSD